MLRNTQFTPKHVKLLQDYCKIQHSTHKTTQFVIFCALNINKPPDYAGFDVLSDLRCTFSVHASRAAVTAPSFITELRSSALKIAALGHRVRPKHCCIDSPGSTPPYIYICILPICT